MGINVDEYFKSESKWLKAADLKKQKHRVTIASVELVEFENQGQKEQKLAIHFSGRNLGLICNKTNADTIKYLHTPDTDNWIGQDIILYPTMVDFGGRSVEAIRVELPMEEAPPHEWKTPEPEPKVEATPSPYLETDPNWIDDIPF